MPRLLQLKVVVGKWQGTLTSPKCTPEVTTVLPLSLPSSHARALKPSEFPFGYLYISCPWRTELGLELAGHSLYSSIPQNLAL